MCPHPLGHRAYCVAVRSVMFVSGVGRARLCSHLFHTVWQDRLVGLSRSGHVEVDRGELFYVSDGDGPPIVLVHGGPFLDHRMWNPQLALQDDYTVIRYDLRGYGRSSQPTGPYRHCDDLVALIGGLGYSSAHIVGLSFGGTIAIDTALAYPDAVDGLVLTAVAPLNGWEWVDGNPVAPALRLLRTDGVDAVKAAFLELPMLDAAREHPAVVALLQEMSDESHAWHMRNRDPAIWAEDNAVHRLAEIDVPALVVIGDRDAPDVRMIGDALADKLPRAAKVVMNNISHLPNLEDPAEFNRHLRHSLSNPPQASSSL